MQLLTPLALVFTVCLANSATAFPWGWTRPSDFSRRPPVATPKTTNAKVITQCTVKNTAAITFDDGPYIYQPDIVKVLKQYNAKATFFVNGNNWGCIYDDVNVKNLKAAYAAGHQIASHTWAHLDLALQDQETIESEMDRTQDAIAKITGATPAFVRPPYGSYDELVQQVAGSRALTIANWDFDSSDTVGASANQTQQAYTDLAAKKPPTILALNHETVETTAKTILPFALKTLAAKGYKFVTVAECLGMQPYKKTGTAPRKDASWTCDESED